MFIKVNSAGSPKVCLLGYGHVEPVDDDRFRVLNQAAYIKRIMSPAGRVALFEFYDHEDVERIAEDWHGKIGIKNRAFFKGQA